MFRDCPPAYSIEVLSAAFGPDPLWKAFEVNKSDWECRPIKLQRVPAYFYTSVPRSENGRYLELSVEQVKLATFRASTRQATKAHEVNE